MSGYIEEEKLNIVKKYLLPKQLKEHALEADFIKMDDEVIIDILNSILESDFKIKNGLVRDTLSIEMLISKYCKKEIKKS